MSYWRFRLPPFIKKKTKKRLCEGLGSNDTSLPPGSWRFRFPPGLSLSVRRVFDIAGSVRFGSVRLG